MTDVIVLTCQDGKGEKMEVHYRPTQGMNFTSFRKGNIEIIDQTTKALFEDRYAGLGAMIGPHFHHRNPKNIPKVEHESLFPHIARLRAKGVQEPFSHGIGRYAPWTVIKVNSNSIEAILKGSDKWNGIPLQNLEGQNFTLYYKAVLLPQGLEIELSVVSDIESVVGLHTYYALSGNQGKITAHVQDHYRSGNEFKPLDSTWNVSNDKTLTLDANQIMDFGFLPAPDPLKGSILLETKTHQVHISYSAPNEENSFQIWHPEGASFVCIEPISARNPQKPILSVSTLKILVSIYTISR